MKKFIAVFGISILILLSLNSCAPQIHSSIKIPIGSERIFDKNYEIDQKLAAYVGQPIIKVKDYNVNRFKAKHMRASDDFVITGGMVTMSGDKYTDYAVRGTTELNGKPYTVLNLPGSFGSLQYIYSVRIGSDGSVHPKVLNGNIVMVYSFTASPPYLRFTSSVEEEIDVEAGYLNYELIYGGTDGKTVTITYREYTSDNMAKPAFFQNLVYDESDKNIRFRDIVIQIHEATNEKIVFTVLSDGLSN